VVASHHSMPSPSLALPGVLFVGEDERARLVAHLGAAAGWMVPKGITGWSTEVSVVARGALSEQVRRDAKIVMPEEQIPPAKMPLSHQAALKSPLVGVSSRLTQKLVDAGIRVHTIGADRVTSSFYYIAEGGGEDAIRVEGDLVAAVGHMLGERADNAAIERVLDGLVDRLLRSLSKDRVAELSLELAAALPRAAADGSGMQDVDLDAFEKELAQLIGSSEKYAPFLREIASKIAETNERKVEIPLFGDARKVSQGPFDLQVGEKKVPLTTYERWLATGPLTEPTAKPATPAPQPVVVAKPVESAPPKAQPAPVAAKPVEAKPEPAKPVEAKPTTPKPAPTAAAPVVATAPPPNVKPLAAPMNPPRPASNPPAKDAAPNRSEAQVEPVGAAVAAKEPVKEEPAKAKEPEVIKQSGSTERPKPAASTPDPAVPKAAPVPSPGVQTSPTPSPAAAAASKAPTPSPSPVAAKATPQAPESKPDVHARDERMATTQKVKRKEKGIPWLWIIVLIAAAFAGYRLWYSRMGGGSK
jgi:hypothetical protein